MRRTWRLGAGVSVGVWAGRHRPEAGTVPRHELEQAVADSLERTVGTRPTRVICPDALAGRVGATVRGTLVAEDGSTIGFTVRANRVQGTRVGFAIRVDGQPGR